MLSADFYPTPKALIERMLEGLSLDHRSYVLEPSAGKGDICDYVKEHKANYYGKAPHIDVIELDTDLQHVLRGKGYNLIHDDFLTFDTQRAYDLLIANFPFSDGDAHLQRALALLERTGGQLVCLVNAETIRNPYTTLRQSVVNTLTNAGATIEYIAGAFQEAERPTDVEVALIRASFTRPHQDSIVLKELRAAEPEVRAAEAQTQVVDSNIITALVARYALEARAGVRLIDEYYALLPYIAEKPMQRNDDGDPPSAQAGIIRLEIGKEKYITHVSAAVNAYLEALREKYWSLLIRNDNFTSAYTSNIIKELEQRMDELKQADFTPFNIQKLERELRSQIVSGIEKAILDLFDELSRKYAADQYGNLHYYTGWKSNAAHKINPKVIIPMNGISAYGNHLEYSIQETLKDMVKVFRYLQEDEVDIHAMVEGASRQAEATQDYRNIALHYFTVTFYLKGTAHITFKNQKLLDKFNIFAAQRRGWLPPGYGKKAYADMAPEEQAVVDDFQGKDSYADVVAQQEYYLVSDRSIMLASGSLTGDTDADA